MIGLFLFAAVAAAAADPCAPNQSLKVEKSIPVDAQVNYFIRSAPGSGEVSFASGDQNYILNVSDGSLSTVEGQIDPVLSPDGKLLSVPRSWYYDLEKRKLVAEGEYVASAAHPIQYFIGAGQVMEAGVGDQPYHATTLTPDQVAKSGKAYMVQKMSFYLKANGNWKEALQDPSADSNYQSMGIVKDRPGRVPFYRMLIEGADGLYIHEYTVNGSGTSVVPSDKGRKICPGFHGSLPMLSKDGKEFSSFDSDSGTTKIFSIGAKGEECKQVDSIPALVGKVDFSPDGRHLAFHVDQGADTGEFGQPGSHDDLGVFLYDRTSKALIPASIPPGQNSYYPVFLSNDKIAFISSAKNGDGGVPGKFKIDIADISQARANTCQGCFDEKTKSGQLAALLGALELSHCRKEQSLPFRNSISAFSQMSGDSCAALASGCDEKCLQDRVGEITATVAAKEKVPVIHDPLDPSNLPAREQWSLDTLKAFKGEDLRGFCSQLRRDANAPAATKDTGASAQ